jgi:hypothetical protein
MADPTPTDLLEPADADAIKQSLIDYQQAIPGNPIRDWNVGGVERTILELEAVHDADLIGAAVPAMIGSGFPEFAVRNWLSLGASQLFGISRGAPVVAVQTMTLRAGSIGYTVIAGQLWFQGLTGNRWVNTTGGTLASSGSLVIQISAEGPGAAYNDPAGTIKTMLTPLIGVTAANEAPDFSVVTPGLVSTGTITPSRTSGGVTPTPTAFLVRIDSPGQVGAGAWSYSVDGGRSWRSPGVIATTALLLGSGAGSGTTITFANGAVTPSFAAGDVFAFATPGTPFVTIGKDQEPDAELAARCLAQWPDISLPPAQSRWLTWAKRASAEVTRVRAEEDPVYYGKLYLTLAGILGPVSGGAVTAVQAYVDPRAPLGRILVAQAASTLEIGAGGTAVVAAARLGEVQSAAQVAWVAVLQGADIGGVVKIADLVKVVMDAGAIDLLSPTLNSGSADIALASTQVAILKVSTPLLANQLTWQAV